MNGKHEERFASARESDVPPSANQSTALPNPKTPSTRIKRHMATFCYNICFFDGLDPLLQSKENKKKLNPDQFVAEPPYTSRTHACKMK